MKGTFFLILFYLFGMVCMAQTYLDQRRYELSTTPLYNEFKNTFWLVNPPCDSTKLVCIKGKAKIWKEDDGGWAIVPVKNSTELWIALKCGHKNIDTLKYFSFKDFSCYNIYFNYECYNPLLPKDCLSNGQNFFSHGMSAKTWKELLAKYKAKQTVREAVNTSIKVIIGYDQYKENLLEQYPLDLRFKFDTCTVKLFNRKGLIKYEKNHTTNEFQLDLETIIEKMQKGDLLSISIPNIFRVDYAGQKKLLSPNPYLDEGWGDDPFLKKKPKKVEKCLEVVFDVVE